MKKIFLPLFIIILTLCCLLSACSKNQDGQVQNKEDNNSLGEQSSVSQTESGRKDEFGIDYVEIDNYYNASVKKELPSSIQSITIDNEHNGKPVVGFYLSTDDTVSIDTIIIPENCENVCINSPNITINKIIINGTKDAVSCMPMFCKNAPLIEYTK